MPEIKPDRSDEGRCISVHWSLPVQCVLPGTHWENWHEAWHPVTGDRIRYRRAYGIFRTEELTGDDWSDLGIPPPVSECDEFLARLTEAEADRDRAREEAKEWHDSYQQHANAVDEFFGDLLELLPGAQDEGMDAYDQIPRGIKALREQVRVVRLVGENEAQRAAHEARDAERRGWQSRRAVENVTLADLKRDRDRARDAAVALEQENARLTAELERMRAEATYDEQEAANFHAEEAPF